jgi:hypothetical protein
MLSGALSLFATADWVMARVEAAAGVKNRTAAKYSTAHILLINPLVIND